MNEGKTMLCADPRGTERIRADVVIAGCGAAGLYAALCLDPSLSCALLNKAGAEVSNSMYAQGGISAVISTDPGQLRAHVSDTLTAGAGLCDEAAVRLLVREAGENIEHLIRLGVPFDRSGGELLFTREGGHGERRILHCGGDATGLHLTKSLYETAKKRENLHFYDDVALTDLLTDVRGVCGVLTLSDRECPLLFESRCVIVATGGAGQVFRESTNAVCATGDGIFAAARAGAALRDMEFVQFHPTALTGPDGTGRYFLVSEALRGEGALLRNNRGETFMRAVHPKADLAPRDIVSRAIVKELASTGGTNVFLDITDRPRDYLQKRFPTIYAECMRRGIDIARDTIPVQPVQHYLMGGVRTNADGQTTVGGLYACGEAASTGVHGANRLASNSLLECLVYGRRAARHISGSFRAADSVRSFDGGNAASGRTPDFSALCTEIRTLMSDRCGIIRNGERLGEACARLTEIVRQLQTAAVCTRAAAEANCLAGTALIIADAALRRRGSVGAHYRNDDLGGNIHG